MAIFRQGVTSLLAIGIFFVAELLLEGEVMVGSTELVNWQMFSCYVPRDSFGSAWVNILIVLLSGGITGAICYLLNKGSNRVAIE